MSWTSQQRCVLKIIPDNKVLLATLALLDIFIATKTTPKCSKCDLTWNPSESLLLYILKTVLSTRSILIELFLTSPHRPHSASSSHSSSSSLLFPPLFVRYDAQRCFAMSAGLKQVTVQSDSDSVRAIHTVFPRIGLCGSYHFSLTAAVTLLAMLLFQAVEVWEDLLTD